MAKSRWNGRDVGVPGDAFGDDDGEGFDFRGWDGVREDQAAKSASLNGNGTHQAPTPAPAPATPPFEQYAQPDPYQVHNGFVCLVDPEEILDYALQEDDEDQGGPGHEDATRPEGVAYHDRRHHGDDEDHHPQNEDGLAQQVEYRVHEGRKHNEMYAGWYINQFPGNNAGYTDSI